VKRFISFFATIGFFAIINSFSPSLGQVPPFEPDQSVYLELMQDLFDEVLTMDQISEPVAERKVFIGEFQNYLRAPASANPALVPGKSWSGIWPPAPIVPSSKPDLRIVDGLNQREQVIKVRPPDLSAHALLNIRTYVEQRLGEKSVRALEQGKVVAVVYGGELASALRSLSVSPSEAVRIPSFYESWGIQKVYVPSRLFPDRRPRLVYVVPPSLQYLEHYAAMMGAINARVDRVVLDLRDQDEYRRELRESLAKISNRLMRSAEGQPDFVVLGYYNQWQKVLKSSQSDWLLLAASEEVLGEMGLAGRLLTLKHRSSGEIQSVLLINSRLTMWGQAAAFIADAALELRPKGLLFMGSSGAMANNLEIYGLSVPRSFQTRNGKLAVRNFIADATQANGERIGETSVNYGAQHGNTFSPIEQDRTFLDHLKIRGIDTIDVEQSLVAEAVERYNRTHGESVSFGAINLITDRPSHIFDSAAPDHDLDRVDHRKKDQARSAAVLLALKSFESFSDLAVVSACQAVF
jgi:hypothetical protein